MQVGQPFRCDPINLCQKARCCRSRDTQPALTVGDFIRLSRFEGKSTVQLWRERGEVKVSHPKNLPPDVVVITLGLKHDPCEYLSEIPGCQVYAVRPLACSGFPFWLYVSGEQEGLKQYENYPCLAGIRPSEQQLEQGRTHLAITEEEHRIDLKYYWVNKPMAISIPHGSDLMGHTLRALDVCMEIDPQGLSPRTRKVVAAATKFTQAIREMDEGRRKDLDFGADDFGALFSALLFPLLGGEFASRFQRIEDFAVDKYRPTTDRYLALLQQMRDS